MAALGTSEDTARANYVYYFGVGQGQWRGQFSLRVTAWRFFWRQPLGLKNRFLVFALILWQKLFGPAQIDSVMTCAAAEEVAGVANNLVRIHKGPITLYLLREQYHLDPDGSHVEVTSEERFGPIPFMFRGMKQHPAVIFNGGLNSIYYMPLVGSEWTGEYRVASDRNQVDAVLRCLWAEATEKIARIAS